MHPWKTDPPGRQLCSRVTVHGNDTAAKRTEHGCLVAWVELEKIQRQDDPI